VRRLPTARATLYYATDVRLRAGGPSMTGLFCEGPHTGGFEVPCSCGEIIAFKIRPGALRVLLGIPAREVRDRTVSLRDIWGPEADSLADRMASAPTADERATILQSVLAARLASAQREDRVALGVSGIIERRAGKVQVRELIARSGYSQRALLNKFDEFVGLTPKQYARLTRLRAVVAELGDGSPEDWAALALKGGYCDQSHMIHEFQDMVGLPPSKFIERRGDFSPAGGPAAGRNAVPSREQRLYRSVGMVSTWLDR
jgi:AraC-like DNA-binding protein